MHDTEATITTSSRSSSARVAEWRMRSICSLMDPSRYRCRCAEHRPRAGSSRNRRRNTRPRCREEGLELAIKLRGSVLLGARISAGRCVLDHLGHGEGFARAGDAEQHLHAVVAADAVDQLLDRQRLVARGSNSDLMTRRWPPSLSPAAAAGAASRSAGAALFGVRVGLARSLSSARMLAVTPSVTGCGDGRWRFSRRGSERSKSVAVVRRVADDRLLDHSGRSPTICELGVEFGRLFRDIASLRPLLESLGRFPRLVGVSEIGAAVERIVRRRARSASRRPRCPSRCRD